MTSNYVIVVLSLNIGIYIPFTVILNIALSFNKLVTNAKNGIFNLQASSIMKRLEHGLKVAITNDHYNILSPMCEGRRHKRAKR